MTVYQKDNGKWYCLFQVNNERKHKLCAGAKDERQALEMETAFKFRLMQQQNGVIPRDDKGVATASVLDSFLEYSEPNKKSHKQDKSRVKILKEYFKSRYAKDIKPNDIEKLKSHLLKKKLSKVTVNRYLEILSKAFNMAIDNELLEKNPIKKNTKFIQKNYVVRSLSIDEENRLMKVLSQPRYAYLRGIVIVALNTGLRRQNILDLTWEQIDLNGRIIEITENKANKHILKPINDQLLAYFNTFPFEQRKGYVFINPLTKQKCKEIKRAWRTVKEKANIENFRFHDLKHTLGTRLAQMNIPMPVIREVLDHSDMKTTMRYVHTANSQILSALNQLNSYNEDLIQNDKYTQNAHTKQQEKP